MGLITHNENVLTQLRSTRTKVSNFKTNVKMSDKAKITDETAIDVKYNVMHSCYDCNHYKYDIQSGFIDTPADPFCEKTRQYDGFKNFPFKKTKCALFASKNCA